MKILRRLGLAAVVSGLGVALACSGGGGSGGASGGACGDYFDALFAGHSCNGPVPPGAEVARERALFLTVCAHELALPGVGITSGELESCASAVRGAGSCGLGVAVESCTFAPGGLAGGAACADGAQCKSGQCTRSVSSDGGTAAAACGSCTTAAAIGQPCASGACASGAVCDSTPMTPVCVALTYGGAGATCDSIAAPCKPGLYCDPATRACKTPGVAGAACDGSQACSGALVCSGAPGTCQAAGKAGAPCQGDSQCASGLGCSTVSHQCASVTWVASGQACGDTRRCTQGSCVPASGGTGTGTCPTILADGQPCGGSTAAVCDVFSQCLNGACVQQGSQSCQ